MPNIITYWSFDILHLWHLNLLRTAKEIAGDGKLIVWLSTDEFNGKKGKICTLPYWHRYEILKSVKYIDEIIPEYSRDQKNRDIVAYNAKMVMWDDRRWKFDSLNCYYLPRTPQISSSFIKSIINGTN